MVGVALVIAGIDWLIGQSLITDSLAVINFGYGLVRHITGK